MKNILASIAAVSVVGTVVQTAQAAPDQLQVVPDQAQAAPATTAQHKIQKTANKYTVNADALRVRTGPNTSSTILGLVTQGQPLQVVGEVNGWYKIQYNNKDAYVSKDYVTPGQVVVDAVTLRVHTGPSTSHSTLGLVGQGQILQVTGETDGWYKIQYNDKDAYVSKAYVTTNGTAVKVAKATVQANGKYIVNVPSLRVRTGPSTSHPILSALDKGQVVHVVGEVQDWYKIQFNGQVAYISKDYVSPGTDETSVPAQSKLTESVQQDGTYIVDAAVLRVRTGSASYYPVIGGILKGQALQVTDVENGWYKIKYNGRTGFVSGKLVKFVKGASVQQQSAQQEKTQQPVQQQSAQQEKTQHPVQQQSAQQEKTQHPVQQQSAQQEKTQQPVQQQSTQQEKTQQPVQQQSAQQEKTQQPAQHQQTQQPAQDYYVKPSSLNVRSGAGMNYGVTGVIQSGQKVQVVGQQAGWYEINYNGQTGFVGKSHLSQTPVTQVESAQTSQAAQPAQPAKPAQPAQTAQPAKPAQPTQTAQPAKPAQPTKPAQPASNAAALIEYAKSLKGVPYVWGGTTPSGFDCSGFIYHVYSKFGYSFGRASVADYWDSFTKTSNPQPGDLIYFQNTYKPGASHMGVYLGNGTFVEAGDSGVAIASLSNSYWNSHFLGYTKPY
ncbi:SH3 domain-containing protein [Ectobacillus panaciterrae]|uniref:C40 family peptidase n=1 Tax=Ectobacillus panaciterrae TaxID=363872 RepID=UPI000409D742|nr:SH3 domain-containing protein [Ectobacillus panaciterrae]